MISSTTPKGRFVAALCLAFAFLLAAPAYSQEVDHSQHDMSGMDHSAHGQADASGDKPVYTSHAGHIGAWMFEYRFMRMFQKGVLDGTDEIDPQSVLWNSNYSKDRTYPNNIPNASPESITTIGTDMTMDMHMIMAMYNQTRKLTWMVMFNYLKNDMTMLDQMSSGGMIETLKMDSAGIGDTQLFMIYNFAKTDWFRLSYTLGLNLPSGSIDAPDGIPDMSTGEEGIAPYDMQLGSGTYDIITALTLENEYKGFDFGAEIYRVSRTGLNAQFYNMGDTLKFWGWGRYRFNFGTQIRTALTQRMWSPVTGRDERMSDNTRYTGGKRLEVTLGVGQAYGDFAVYVDYNYPLLQRLNGVQMKTTGILTFGLQYMYM